MSPALTLFGTVYVFAAVFILIGLTTIRLDKTGRYGDPATFERIPWACIPLIALVLPPVVALAVLINRAKRGRWLG